MSTGIDFDAVWGGYYAGRSADSGEYSIFRLLDFNQHAYHAALFSEKFQTLPSDSVVLALKPFIGHAPIDARALVHEGDLTLVGRAPLTQGDLEGYLYYLEAHDVPESERVSLAASLIGFSHEPPLRLRLELTTDALDVSERT